MIDAKEVLEKVTEDEIEQFIQVYHTKCESDLKNYFSDLKKYFGDWWGLNGTPKSDAWYLLAWSYDEEEPFSADYDMIATYADGKKCYIYELQ